MAKLRHHRHTQEGQAENVERHQRAVERIHVGERVRDRFHTAGLVTTLPDDRIGEPFRLDLGSLVDAIQIFEKVAVLFFLRDL